MHLGRRQPARQAGRAGGRDRAVADVQVEVDVQPAVAGAGDVERLAHAVGDPASGDLGAADDGDAAGMRLGGVGAAVRPVGDADLHDPLAGQPGLDQVADRRAVAAALAQVVVGVEGDQAGARRGRRRTRRPSTG